MDNSLKAIIPKSPQTEMDNSQKAIIPQSPQT